MKSEPNIFISDCGEFVAVRVPGIQPNFDVWRHDGSEMWEGNRYVEVPGKKECYNPRRLYTDNFTHPKKIVGSWSKLGHRAIKGKDKGTWIEAFEVILHDLDAANSITVRFNTSIKSLSPSFIVRRKQHIR